MSKEKIELEGYMLKCKTLNSIFDLVLERDIKADQEGALKQFDEAKRNGLDNRNIWKLVSSPMQTPPKIKIAKELEELIKQLDEKATLIRQKLDSKLIGTVETNQGNTKSVEVEEDIKSPLISDFVLVQTEIQNPDRTKKIAEFKQALQPYAHTTKWGGWFTNTQGVAIAKLLDLLENKNAPALNDDEKILLTKDSLAYVINNWLYDIHIGKDISDLLMQTPSQTKGHHAT